ncbi:MAG: ABC transporter ATP-binding protein [Pseudomonadota bacterium]|nr:ABC transporter ATP-binding protein [Pseudomonadota bacterium]
MTTNPTSAAISIRGLEKRYGDRTVLRRVSLDIAEGERVALVGPNGSGKTTLMRVVLGFVRGEGQVTVGGVDPWSRHAEAMAGVAYVPQRAPALAAPVRELTAAWARLRGQPASALDEIATDFGLDLVSVRGVAFAALSGGMQQKLLAAMALASTAPILLFDEPTANLDPAAREVFLSRLAARPGNPGKRPTVLLSSHRLDELRDLVDRVVVLTDGAVTFDDRLPAFLDRPELARAAGVLAFRRNVS